MTAELTDEALLANLQRDAFGYFTQAANPTNGLIGDTSREGSPVSIAVVGFALSSYPVVEQHRTCGTSYRPQFMSGAGFGRVEETQRIRTPLGTMSLYRAQP